MPPTTKNVTVNRAALGHRITYALRHPGRVPRHLVRSARDMWLRRRHPDHIAYYRAVMRSDTRADPDAAVGSRSRERWLALGAMQRICPHVSGRPGTGTRTTVAITVPRCQAVGSPYARS